LTQVSSDHTYVQKLVDAGQLAPDAARRHPWRNVVLRSLQADPHLAREGLDVVELEPRVGDRYLLCSDGLTDLVPEERIAEVLEIADPHSAAARLVEDALLAGGTDNVTCLVFDVIDGPQVCGDGMLIGAVLDVGNIVDAAAVRIA
jgi:serine/threonine protein phosphatase PrpC